MYRICAEQIFQHIYYTLWYVVHEVQYMCRKQIAVCNVSIVVGTSLIRNIEPLGPYSRPMVPLGGGAVSYERVTLVYYRENDGAEVAGARPLHAILGR